MSNEGFKLRGQTLSDAYADWIKAEFKIGSAQRQEFGRFAFNVSAGTVGVIFTIAKFADRTALGNAGGFGITMLFLSTVIALVMAIPPLLEVDGETDLVVMHRATAKSFRRFAWWWFAVWFVGAVAGAADLIVA